MQLLVVLEAMELCTRDAVEQSYWRGTVCYHLMTHNHNERHTSLQVFNRADKRLVSYAVPDANRAVPA